MKFKTKIMATVTLKGNAIHTSGELPKVGQKAPDFKLTVYRSIHSNPIRF